MKKCTRRFLLMIVSFSICFACKKQEIKEPAIDGLWLIKKVKIEEDEMTPIARWVEFNKDSTQMSGNGWLKHSYGTWSLNKTNHLKINNTNGLIDNADPFLVNIHENEMTWKRKEDNQNVEVYLKRIKEKPSSIGNKLMGLWKLESYKISDKDVTAKENPKNNQTLYFSWDNVFREHNLLSGKRTGVYKIHGHRPELQMVNYGADPTFSFWNFSFIDDVLILTSRDKKTIKKYHRIYKFLQ